MIEQSSLCNLCVLCVCVVKNSLVTNTTETQFRTPATPLLLLELQRDRVHAITLSGWTWAIVEHVTQMRTAAMTTHFGALHPQCLIRYLINTHLGNRRGKTGPPGSRVKLRV